MYATSSGGLRFAPTDLSRFLACRHLTFLARSVALKERPEPFRFEDPHRDALAEAGRKHEAQVLERFRKEGLSTETVPGKYEEQERNTLAAMRRGVEVIYQGRLREGQWSGYPDFLLRVERPSALGGWSYEVVDAKLALVAKADAVLQIAVYSRLLEPAQGAGPEQMHLALGDGAELEPFRVDDFAAFERALRKWFEAHCADPADTYPEPVGLCSYCEWDPLCKERRRKDDHLSLVAGSNRGQRKRLERHGVTTLAGLARLPLPPEPPVEGIPPASLLRIHRQARAQLTGRELGRPFHELLAPPEEGRGLLRLPEPCEGDLFFDIESTRATAEGGLEYLFGWVERDRSYGERWGFDRAEERQVFESFLDLVAERRKRFPDLHIYHYGGYETGALKRLMGRYATREDALDNLLRRQVFVDLLQVVRQGLVASVESYSIKKMEPFYGFERDQDLQEAIGARGRMGAALDAGAPAAPEDREVVRRYNREDCLSTLELHGWLEARRRELTDSIGFRPRPVAKVEKEREEAQTEAALRVAALVERLRAGGTEEEAPARELLGHFLDFHRREDKSGWWEFFHRCDLDAEELLEDRHTLGGLEYEGEAGQEKLSTLHGFRFPPQEHGVEADKGVRDAATKEGTGTVVEITDGRLLLKRGSKLAALPYPAALVPFTRIKTDAIRESLFALGEEVAATGFADESPRRAAFDLLRRVPPRGGASGASLRHPGEEPVAAARRLALGLDRSVLGIQGPPGSGKTYTGARIITGLLAAGKRVGVTAQSHQVITNLLDSVCRAADEEGVRLSGVQIGSSAPCRDRRIEARGSSSAGKTADDHGIGLIAGTAWLWARPEMTDSVDVLVVDEAGQFSLANTLAAAQAAASLVLLGDPQQLDQVTQGVHPDGSEASALGHLLGKEKTIPSDRGLFLGQTWRMHPDICRFTSELFYEGLLKVRGGLERQEITGGPLPGAGLRFVPVEHEGNQRDSEEEAERLAELVGGLLAEASWTDAAGRRRRLEPQRDILVVAPYNAQVDLLARKLGDSARVGTVDKFQGQEAPVVFYSMATSTPEEAPRGMDFLYSLNRLNVATSRARCLAVIVASPELFFPECHTPQQMRLANAFCRFRELGQAVA